MEEWYWLCSHSYINRHVLCGHTWLRFADLLALFDRGEPVGSAMAAAIGELDATGLSLIEVELRHKLGARSGVH